jgi:hypothetical protein
MVYHAPCFMLLCFMPLCFMPFGINTSCLYTTCALSFALRPLANLHHILICPLFQFNTLWLAVFYYANPLFLKGISFFIYAHFFRNSTRVLKQWLHVIQMVQKLWGGFARNVCDYWNFLILLLYAFECYIETFTCDICVFQKSYGSYR